MRIQKNLSKLLIISLFIVVGAAACSGGFGVPADSEVVSTSLQDIDDIQTLKQVFNEDTGSIRIILLLSPT